MSAASLHVHTTSIDLPFLLFVLQIHANCRIRRVYFSDRIYSYQELPKAFKVNIAGESQAAASTNAGIADKSSMVSTGLGGLQGPGIDLNKQTIGTGLQTTTAGHDCMRGIQSILNSIEKDPLILWKKQVSVIKTKKSEKPVGLVVHQTFSIITVVYYQ